MNFFQFMDIKYQEVSIELGQDYSLTKDGRAKAIHSLIGTYRILSKWLHFPILLTEFLLMKTKLTQEPISPLKTKPQLVKENSEIVTQN